MTTLSIRNSINRSPLRCGLLLTGISLSFGLLALSPQARAACQDGCDSSGNTFLGDAALINNTTGNFNTAIGDDALESNTTGDENTATGGFALSENTTGNDNAAYGYGALNSNTTGSENTATGPGALASNTNGADNTANGFEALGYNTTGSRNVATGFSALYSNQIGIDNTAIGFNALYANTADYNTATGYQALESNTTGSNNTANGIDTLNSNTSGSNNVASGASALFNNSAGSNNTATGFDALYYNTNGLFNTANGFQALFNNTTGTNNTADGVAALSSNTFGSTNIAVGFQAGFNLTTGSNNIDIGNIGVAGESGKIRIGTKPTHKDTFIAGIFGVTVPTGVAVLIDNSGHLGTTTSSARFKEAIKPMDKASEAILALNPVTFRYKHELDPDGIPQFGLVAEEVEKVNPNLVARDDEGKPYTVRYEAVNAMLLNEFLKEHRKVEELARTNQGQQATIAQQQRAIEMLTTRLNAQESQIQKISEQVKMNNPVARVVASTR